MRLYLDQTLVLLVFNCSIFTIRIEFISTSSILYFTIIEYLLLSFTFFLFPLSLFFFLFFLLPWWKLSEASPSATVFIYTRLCPLLKVFLCCSTLWALSCLVSLLVTLLALTDSQVKYCESCMCLHVAWPSPGLSHSYSVTVSRKAPWTFYLIHVVGWSD